MAAHRDRGHVKPIDDRCRGLTAPQRAQTCDSRPVGGSPPSPPARKPEQQLMNPGASTTASLAATGPKILRSRPRSRTPGDVTDCASPKGVEHVLVISDLSHHDHCAGNCQMLWI